MVAAPLVVLTHSTNSDPSLLWHYHRHTQKQCFPSSYGLLILVSLIPKLSLHRGGQVPPAGSLPPVHGVHMGIERVPAMLQPGHAVLVID